MESESKIFRMSASDEEKLRKYSETLVSSCKKIFEELHFKWESENGERVLRNSNLIDGQLILSDEIRKSLADFASKTFYLADDMVLFSIFKELIDHQLRVIQYYRLFDRFALFEKLSARGKELLKDYRTVLKKALVMHDLDKLDDEVIIQHYISQHFLGDLDVSDELRFIFSKIRAALRRIHGDTNKHHSEYYDCHEEEKSEITAYTILEHVLDVIAVGDKKSEIHGDFYRSKKDTSLFRNFSEKFDDLIVEIYKIFNDSVLEKTAKLKKELEDLKEEKQKTDAIKAKIRDLQLKISDETEKIVWQSLDYVHGNTEEHLDDTMRCIKEISRNLYFAIEDDWVQKRESLRYFTIISRYKKMAFEEKIDLLEELKKAVGDSLEEEVRLIKVSALLETLYVFGQKSDAQIVKEADDKRVADYMSANRTKLEAKRTYMRKRNESDDGKNFYVGHTG